MLQPSMLLEALIPMIFAKKAKNITMNEGTSPPLRSTPSLQVTSTVSIASKFTRRWVLNVDDFRHRPSCQRLDSNHRRSCTRRKVGIVIEKSFQDGRALLKKLATQSLHLLVRFEMVVVFKECDI